MIRCGFKDTQAMADRSVPTPGILLTATRRWLAVIFLITVAAGTFSLSAWGEGVDIFPLGGGNGGGISNDGDGPGDSPGLLAVYRLDGGDVWAERSRREHPGVVFENRFEEDLFEGHASDAGAMKVAFEIGLIDPAFGVINLGRLGLKGSGQMKITDLKPDDRDRALLEAGRAGHGVLLVYVGTARPMGKDTLGQFAGMVHVDTIALEHPCVDLGQIRREAQAGLGGSGLDVGLVLFDRYMQYATAVFNVDSSEAKYLVHARDVGRR